MTDRSDNRQLAREFIRKIRPGSVERLTQKVPLRGSSASGGGGSGATTGGTVAAGWFTPAVSLGTCDATVRGKVRLLEGGTGVADDVCTCEKLDTDLYDWVCFGTGGGVGASALDDLTDVNAPAPADGDVLTWTATPGEWVSAAPEAVGRYRQILIADDGSGGWGFIEATVGGVTRPVTGLFDLEA